MSEFMRTFPIKKIVRHHEQLISLYFEKTFEVKPGQFILLWLPEIDEKPISVSDVSENYIEISIKAVGPFTNNILKCREGDFLGIRGPFGTSFTLGKNSLLIGGGIGFAPLRYLARTLSRKRLEKTLLIGVNSANDLIFPGEYQNSKNCTLVSQDNSYKNRGFVTDFISPIIERKKNLRIYAAGPEAMLLKVRDIALEFNIPYEISLERYMKCGIGICGQCCLDGPGMPLCIEGPVVSENIVKQISDLQLPHRTASGKRKLR